jgi:membrane fusion protein (multidrug efflux system)
MLISAMTRFATLVALTALALPACQRTTPVQNNTTAKSVPVETFTVATEDVEVTVQAVGTLKADQVVQLKPKRSGHVRELHVSEGARVDTGEVLVTLDDEALRAQVELARANVVDAQVRERNARQQFERAQALLKKGVASQQQYDDDKAELDRAIAGLGVAQANLSFAEAQLAETVIRAPFPGILGERRVDVGAFVKDGDALVTIVDPDPVELVFAVPERYLGQLRLEQSVETTVVSYSDRVFPGTVTFIAPEVDPINRTVTVKAVIQNPDFALRPGQFATAILHLDRHLDMPVIPEEAVVPDGDRTLVFVVKDGTAEARPIQTGVRLPGRVEVIGGLQAGERLVRTGHEKLKAGTAMPVTEVSVATEG